MKKFILSLLLIAVISPSWAQKKDKKGLPLEASRLVTISTNQGTWLSLDVHPDGSKIIFDLLGDLYELSFNGGKATRLTEGLAFDSQPKYSPDGNSILFLSHRRLLKLTFWSKLHF